MVQESTHSRRPEASPEASPAASDMPQGSAGTRCVVLVLPGGVAPADLLGGLSRRGVSTIVLAEPADVMVELARQRTGAWIVVDPENQPGLADLIQAIKTYHPHTVRWAYQSAPPGKARLQPLNGRPVHKQVEDSPPPESLTAEPHEDEGSNITSPSPLARVQNQVPSDRVRSLVVKVQGPAEVGEPLISEEELAMLLGPVPQEPGGEP